jgi:hypothetical protein
MKRTYRILLLFLLTVHVAFSSACSRFGFDSDSSSPLQLRVQSEANTYAPGQAVALTVELQNVSGAPIQSPPLNHLTVSFLLRPAGPKGQKAIRETLPVFSVKEQLRSDATQSIEPGDRQQRTFLFTQLTVERGDFVLLATCQSGKDSKIHAEPFAFSVQGDRVARHRYLNGLVTRDDAIKLAAQKFRIPTENADAMLIQDEMGFLKWHINLPGVASDGKPVTRSCFVDPYWGRVWREAQPFVRTPESNEIPYPEDSKLFQQLQDQVRSPAKRIPEQSQPTPTPAEPPVPAPNPASTPPAAPSSNGPVPPQK